MNQQEAQIQKYLAGRMNASEQSAFEQELDANSALASSLREALLEKASIWEAGYEAEKAKLNKLFDQASGQTGPASAGSSAYRPQLWMSIAAAIIILVAVGYLVFDSPPQPQELFATHYSLPSAPEQLGVAPGVDSLLQLAHNKYNQGNFQAAIPIYEQVTQLNGRAEGWQYLAYAQLNLGNSQAAIEALLQDTQPNDRSEWMLALAYLKHEQLDKAQEVLSRIANDSDHDFYKQALELKKELE